MSFASSGGSDVGNGGDGVFRDGRLIVRDLVENDLFRRPWLGTSENSALSKEVASWKVPTRLGFDSVLLARKLTDIDERAPGIGFLLLETLKHYDYVLVDHLELLTDIEFDTANGGRFDRLQIAIRWEDEIKINRQSFHQLDPINKIALLIHEGFYALVKRECDNFRCTQKGRYARELTSLSFTREIAMGSLRLRTLELMDARELAYACAPPPLEIRFRDSNPEGRSYFFKSATEYLSTIPSLCQNLSSDGEFKIYANMLTVKKEIYTALFGPQFSFRLQLSERTERGFVSQKNCESDLLKTREFLALPKIQIWHKFCAHPFPAPAGTNRN